MVVWYTAEPTYETGVQLPQRTAASAMDAPAGGGGGTAGASVGGARLGVLARQLAAPHAATGLSAKAAAGMQGQLVPVACKAAKSLPRFDAHVLQTYMDDMRDIKAKVGGRTATSCLAACVHQDVSGPGSQVVRRPYSCGRRICTGPGSGGLSPGFHIPHLGKHAKHCIQCSGVQLSGVECR